MFYFTFKVKAIHPSLRKKLWQKHDLFIPLTTEHRVMTLLQWSMVMDITSHGELLILHVPLDNTLSRPPL